MDNEMHDDLILSPGGIGEVRRHPVSRAEMALVATLDARTAECERLRRLVDRYREAKDDRNIQVWQGIDQIVELEAKVSRLQEHTCGSCGRSLPPDGDCYGCEVDRLRAKLEAVREFAYKLHVYSDPYRPRVGDDLDALLAGEGVGE